MKKSPKPIHAKPSIWLSVKLSFNTKKYQDHQGDDFLGGFQLSGAAVRVAHSIRRSLRIWRNGCLGFVRWLSWCQQSLKIFNRLWLANEEALPCVAAVGS